MFFFTFQHIQNNFSIAFNVSSFQLLKIIPEFQLRKKNS